MNSRLSSSRICRHGLKKKRSSLMFQVLRKAWILSRTGIRSTVMGRFLVTRLCMSCRHYRLKRGFIGSAEIPYPTDTLIWQIFQT